MRFLLSLLLVPLFSFAQHCPPYGNASNAEGKRINRLKNTSIDVSQLSDPEFVPLENFLPKTKRNDSDWWWEGAYIYTDGYITSAEEQGPESCNCNKAKKTNRDGDVHIYQGLVTDAPKKNCMVIEITPAFKKQNPDYETYMEEGIKVRVYGFLFYDKPHEGNAFTTCSSCQQVWRKTCWEVHPITQIEVIE